MVSMILRFEDDRPLTTALLAELDRRTRQAGLTRPELVRRILAEFFAQELLGLDDTLQRVRVEVHLSNGIELGPTTPADLGPGQQRDLELKATAKDFDGWSAHPEVGSGEHGGEGSEDGGEEHGGGEGEGEEHDG